MTTHTSTLACVFFSKNWVGKARAGLLSSADTERTTAAALKTSASVVFFSEGDDADLIAAIHLPSGCRVGQCESCVVSVGSGQVRHLIDSVDLDEGRCLTCRAVPLTDLVLDA